MNNVELEEFVSWYEDPLQLCAGSRIIPQWKFKPLAVALVGAGSSLTEEELLKLFFEESKRYTACGANSNGRYSVIRKPPKTGWKKLICKLGVEHGEPLPTSPAEGSV